MIAPARRLSAASILQVTGIAVQPATAHDLRNMAMHFYVKPSNPFLFTIILCAVARRARGQKVSLWSDYLPFFVAVASKGCALTPAPLIFVLLMPPNYSSCFSMILDEWGGGGRHDHLVYLQRRGRLRIANLT